jgi:hypothetical protein
LHYNGFAWRRQWMASSLGRSQYLGLKMTTAWHVYLHADVLWGDKSHTAMRCTLGVFERWHWSNHMSRTWWSSCYPFKGCTKGSCNVWNWLGSHLHSQLLERFKCESQTKNNRRTRSRGTFFGS